MTIPIETHAHSRPVPYSLRGIRRLIALIGAVALTAALAACAPADDAAAPRPSAVTIPDSPVGSQAQWVLDELNSASPSGATEIEARFAPIMFEELTVEELQDVFIQLRAARPWIATAYDGSDTEARVRIEASATPYEMTVSVADDGRMNGLFFGAARAEHTPAASWDELRFAIDEAPYTVSLQVQEVGSADPDVLIGEPAAAPIGSIFKLYVLGAVVDAVATGALTWDTPLTIDAAVRSLPSGELQDLPDGSTVTVREAAQKMIEISDNTATDALILAVGRDAVATALADMGHSDPAGSTPFLTTREAFWIGWGEDGTWREQWAGADTVAARETVLADLPAGVPDVGALDWTVPAWKSGVDWFATPDDIVRAHEALQKRAQTAAGEPVRGILSANPGLQLPDEWSYVGYKGGSSVGVLAGSWYLEGDGAAPVVVTLFASADDPSTLADPATVFVHAEDAIALLAAG